MTELALREFGEWPEQRVGLFVDTQNLYYPARDGYRKHLDYHRLLQVAVRGRRLAHATAFVVEREGESTSYGFITKLSAIGYRVRRRTLKLHRLDDQGHLVLEGDWDMGIVAEIVRSWDHLDVVVLASGDGDFVPIVELSQERGGRVEVMAFRETASQALVDAADLFVHLPEVKDIFL
ncbi:MAG: NYN domain-containing protein [Trueperaceae bacterium]|nr:MAG: NYN domain-containing protein [Trueperaceae bacterium]